MLLKSAVVCLALANVAYFLWTRGVGSPEEAVSSRTATSTLKLVAEAGVGAAHASAGDSAGAPRPIRDAELGLSDGALLTNIKRCITVGPFRDVAEAAHAASTLRSGGYDPRQRVIEGELWAGVWVYLPLPASPASSEQLLSKLKAAGIDDALEMPGPVDGSVISLGVFSEQRRADARIAQLQALGLKPGTAERKRTGNVYWVDLDLKPTEGLLNPGDLQAPSGRISRLEVKACPAAGAAS